jgi:hypothetical protein
VVNLYIYIKLTGAGVRPLLENEWKVKYTSVINEFMYDAQFNSLRQPVETVLPDDVL